MTWIQTINGNAFDLLNPRAEDVDFSIISTVLGRILRFGGHTAEPYSVAQHCVEGARAILHNTNNRLTAAVFLLHDAHEAYIGDDVTPKIEALMEFARPFGNDLRQAYRNLQRRIDSAIFIAAGLPATLPDSVWSIVKEYDIRMLRTERDIFMKPILKPWADAVENARPVVINHFTVYNTESAVWWYMDACKDLLPVFEKR